MEAINHPLIKQLNEIPRGLSHWKRYQDICGKILGKLFIPPLERPFEESSTEDGLDRRDWVFPNHATQGFWATMLKKFNADVVLVDAKNYTDAIGKDEVVQIRNYLLRKSSLGKLAIIMSRSPPSESAIMERQQAFHNEGSMILFLCDEEVYKMLWLKKIEEDPSYALDKQRLEVQLRG